jgi:hypothetical protein
LRPMPPHLLEDLQPAARTHTPSERGYLDYYPIGDAPHHEEVQKKLVKLFFARYMSVSDDQIEAAIGYDNNPLIHRESYRQLRRNCLRNIWSGMRYKTFGENSFFDRLVRHKVESYDFEVTMRVIARAEHVLQQVPLDENDHDRTTREANLERFSQAKAEHLSRYNISRNSALHEAQRRVQNIESASTAGMTIAELRAQKQLIDEAKRLVEHHKAHHAPRSLIQRDSEDSEDSEEVFEYYRDLSTRGKQLLWQSEWSFDVGTTMLWEVKNIIDIPATLGNAGFIYKTAFVVFCIEASQIRPEVPTENEETTEVSANPGYAAWFKLPRDRKPLYRHLGAASAVHWPNEPGLDLLRISAGSSRAVKRKADALGSSHAGLHFTKK